MKYALLSSEEAQAFRVRLVVLGAVAAFLLLALLFRIWFMQVVDGIYYEEVAQGNRIRVVPQEAPRGLIYDREGRLLAFNRPAFNLQLVPEDTPDLEATLSNLAYLIGHPYDGLWETARKNRGSLKFKPMLLLEDIGRKSADLVETYQEDLPGVTVAVEPRRLYPAAFTASHLIGYVGEISRGQLGLLPANKVRSGRIVGRAGVELIQNNLLIGTDGGRQVEVDHVGRELRVIGERIDPVPGSELWLTVDINLQQQVKALMGDKQGVAIVMNARTGEILSMNSHPDFDPNVFVGHIDETTWREMAHGTEKVLINKSIQGTYPPGSVFKMVLATAGLDLGHIDKNSRYNCPGYYRLGRDTRKCWRRGGHGEINLLQAIAQSCNVYFYQLGLEVGVDQIYKYARLFGFGEVSGVELESEKIGLLPSRDWKQRALDDRWYPGETMQYAIGQGYLSVTPIQLLAYINTLANWGVWIKPTMVQRITSPAGIDLVKPEDLPRDKRLLPIPPEVFAPIRKGMQLVVNSSRGTAHRSRSRLVTIAGKTGTSQVVSHRTQGQGRRNAKRMLPHSIFAGYAPAADPEISVVVLIEHGNSGSETAAPLAKQIIEYYFRQLRAPSSDHEEIQATAPPHPFTKKLQLAFHDHHPGQDTHHPAAFAVFSAQAAGHLAKRVTTRGSGL